MRLSSEYPPPTRDEAIVVYHNLSQIGKAMGQAIMAMPDPAYVWNVIHHVEHLAIVTELDNADLNHQIRAVAEGIDLLREALGVMGDVVEGAEALLKNPPPMPEDL